MLKGVFSSSWLLLTAPPSLSLVLPSSRCPLFLPSYCLNMIWSSWTSISTGRPSHGIGSCGGRRRSVCMLTTDSDPVRSRWYHGSKAPESCGGLVRINLYRILQHQETADSREEPSTDGNRARLSKSSNSTCLLPGTDASGRYTPKRCVLDQLAKVLNPGRWNKGYVLST